MLVTYLKLVLMSLFWSGAFISGKVLTTHLSPFVISAVRFSIAIVPLIILLGLREGFKKPTKKELLFALVLGSTGVFLYNYFFFTGLITIPANRGSVLLANSPIMVGFFSALILREKLTTKKIVGLLFSVAGAITVISHGDLLSIFREGVSSGDVFILLAIAVWVVYSITGKLAMKTFSPLRATTYSSVIGGILLWIPAGIVWAQAPQEITWVDMSHLVYLGLFATVLGFLWYYEGVQKLGPGLASQFINLVPVFGVLLAGAILGEPLTWSLVVGGLLAFTGIFISNYVRR